MVMAENIISSAILFKPKDSDYFQIMCGKRHCDVFELMKKHQIEYDRDTAIQGFLTESNRFLNRYDAYDLALTNHQISNAKPFNPCLYSEDLW